MVIRTALRREEPRTDIAAIIVEIQCWLDTANRIEERHFAIDIKAQRIRCEAAMFYFENAKAIKAECVARGDRPSSRCSAAANAISASCGNFGELG